MKDDAFRCGSFKFSVSTSMFLFNIISEYLHLISPSKDGKTNANEKYSFCSITNIPEWEMYRLGIF